MANTVDFGTDISCLTSLRTGRYASGPRLVAEAMFRRFSTTKGTLRGGDDEADYGFDLTELIGTTATASAEAALPGQIEAEALKDERVQSVVVTVNSSKLGPAVSWIIMIEGQTAAGPFTLKLAVSEVTTSLLGLTPGV